MLDGNWTITKNLFETTRRLLPPADYPRLLEIGSGRGTEDWVKAGYTVTTVENEIKWVDSTEGAEYIHAPLVGRWYKPSTMAELFKREFDVWLIDGPKGSISDRANILGYLDPKNFPRAIIVDDTHRHDGQAILAGVMHLLRSNGITPLIVADTDNTEPGGPRHGGVVIILPDA